MVQFSTVPGGTAIANQDYTCRFQDILVFPVGILTESFTVPILDDQLTENTTETVNLALTSATGNGIADFQTTAVLNIVDNDLGTSNFFIVTNTQDSGPGSLRQAILDANAHAGPDDIEFAIPASTDPTSTCPSMGSTLSPRRGRSNFRAPCRRSRIR